MVKVKKSKNSRRISRLTLILIIAAVIILAISIILLAIIPRHPRCSGLVGSWIYAGTDYEGDYIYTFQNDGNGNYLTPAGNYSFVYINDDDFISLLYAGNTDYGLYPYSISEDGETLTITDSNNDPIVYHCQ